MTVVLVIALSQPDLHFLKESFFAPGSFNMSIPFVLLHCPQTKTEQFSPGMMKNYLFFNRSYLKLSKQEMYHENPDEFEDHTLISHIGCHIVQNQVQCQHHVTTKH